MKISKDFPPNYRLIKMVFKNCEQHKPLFCYGDTIFNPFDVKIIPDMEVHESIHSRQQGNNPEEWWNLYLTDTDFRLSQEIEAYGTQYAFAIKAGVSGKLLDWAKESMARALSGELYGKLLTYGQAESKIRNFAKNL